MRKTNTLLLFTLICLIIGLLAALTPFSDIDNDGLLDSLVTEGTILIPVLYVVTGLFFLLPRLTSTCLTAPRLFSYLLFPPPIFN
jgi:hypothetical protein